METKLTCPVWVNGWPISIYRISSISNNQVAIPGIELTTNYPLVSGSRLGRIFEIHSLKPQISEAMAIATSRYDRCSDGCLGCRLGRYMAGNNTCQGVAVQQCALAEQKTIIQDERPIVNVVYRCPAMLGVSGVDINPLEPNCFRLTYR